jgi:hypothetical protein
VSKWKHIARYVVVVAIVCTLGACRTKGDCTKSQEGFLCKQISPDLLNNAEFAVIALREVSRRTGVSIDRLQVSSEDIGKDDEGWDVTVWLTPAVPGGHYYVKIDRNGKVHEVEPGA